MLAADEDGSLWCNSSEARTPQAALGLAEATCLSHTLTSATHLLVPHTILQYCNIAVLFSFVFEIELLGSLPQSLQSSSGLNLNGMKESESL